MVMELFVAVHAGAIAVTLDVFETVVTMDVPWLVVTLNVTVVAKSVLCLMMLL